MALATGFFRSKLASSGVPITNQKHAVHCDAFDQKWRCPASDIPRKPLWRAISPSTTKSPRACNTGRWRACSLELNFRLGNVKLLSLIFVITGRIRESGSSIGFGSVARIDIDPTRHRPNGVRFAGELLGRRILPDWQHPICDLLHS